MKRIQRNKSFLLKIFVFPLIITAVACHPIQKNELDQQSDIRDEKHFANGTTIGKYTYTDNEGNPVQVKYYADDESYGVELKTIKVVDSNDALNKYDAQSVVQPAIDQPKANAYPELKPDFKYKSNKLTYSPKVYKKEAGKRNLFKANPDYEVFYQNELKEPQKCGQEKVHVYYDAKENRKMRSVANDLNDADKFCEQFDRIRL